MAIATIPQRAMSEQGFSFRNLIINGDMSIAQRSTSEASKGADAGYFTVDRMYYYENGTTDVRFTQSQSTDVPSGQGFATSLKFDCTTADTSLAVDNQLVLKHRLEGQNLQQLKWSTSNAESVTLSFWIKSTKTGTFVAELSREGGRKISKAYTVSVSDTWEKKTLTFVGDTGGSAISNDNGNRLEVNMYMGVGTNYSSGTLNTSWSVASNTDRAVGQVNAFDDIANNILFTGVQLEVGTSASDFEFLPFDVNLRRCQRYLQQIGYGPYTDQTTGGNRFAVGLRDGGGSTTCYITVPLLSYLRTTPTITYNNINARQDGTDYTISAINTIVNEGLAIQFVVIVTSGFSISNAVQLRYTSTNGYIRFDSEL